MHPSLRFTITILAVVAVIELGPIASARMPAAARSETSMSFSQLQLQPDSVSPDAITYAAPIHYGTFADIEIGSSASGTVQIDITVLEQSALRERRTAVLIPGRVLLVTEILGIENLMEIGSSSRLVRITTSEPVSAILVRRD